MKYWAAAAWKSSIIYPKKTCWRFAESAGAKSSQLLAIAEAFHTAFEA